MQMLVGHDAIGDHGVAFVTQVGMTRVGVACRPRCSTGQYVALRAISWTTLEPVRPTTHVAQRRSAPLARTVALLAVVVVCTRRVVGAPEALLAAAWRLVRLAWRLTFSLQGGYRRRGWTCFLAS